MPQFTIKLHTYDPAIVEAFELLRKSRKQAAFTHEALRYFLASEKASQMIALMSHGHQPPLFQASTGTKHVEKVKDIDSAEQTSHPAAPTAVTKKTCTDVLEKILE